MALDPTNIDALVGAARADVLVGAIFTTEHRAERLADAETLLIKGISIAPRNYWAHMWLGFVQIQTNRASRAIGELGQALSLNRNLGAAHAWMGKRKSPWAAPKRPRLMSTKRSGYRRMMPSPLLDPHPGPRQAPPWSRRGSGRALSPLGRRQPELSAESFLHGRRARHLGRLDEARAEVKAGHALAPNYSIARFLSMAESDNPIYLKQRERILEGLGKPDVPETTPSAATAAG